MPAESPDDALRTLYAQHRHAVLAYAEGFTQDRGQAEDIVQETFLRAWRHLPRLLADDRPVDALGQLSERHRQIVVETFYADSPMHVTAARLGVPAGTARSRLHYALDHLRRQLDPGSAA
jgi:RNA polymerase sigma-70 factor (ECF subfamily)